MTLKRISILFFFLLVCFSYSHAQWVSQWHGFISSRGINHIRAVNANVVWATAFDASNLNLPVNEFTRTTDGGQIWTPGLVNGAEGLQSVGIFALNADTAWIVMQNPADTGGYIFRTNNGGLAWERQDSAKFHNNPVFIHFWDKDTGLVVGNPYNERFEIFTTANGGLDWEAVPAMNIPVSLSDEYSLTAAFHVQGDTTWFGGNTYGKIFVSRDKGHNWSFIPSPLSTLRKVIFYDTLSGLIGRVSVDGDSWDLFQTKDRGLSWTQLNPGGNVNNADLGYVPGTSSTMVSVGFRMSYADDGGSSWITFGQPSPVTSPYFHCVNFIDPSTGWAGGMNTFPNGGIYRYAGPALESPEILSDGNAMRVYPNPATDLCHVAVKGLDHGTAEINLYDMMGREVLHQQYPTDGDELITIDIKNLKPGVYFLRLVQDKNTMHKQLIVK
jgi:photosystem II stability/assembly factor-like uncharacterized protein